MGKYELRTGITRPGSVVAGRHVPAPDGGAALHPLRVFGFGQHGDRTRPRNPALGRAARAAR